MGASSYHSQWCRITVVEGTPTFLLVFLIVALVVVVVVVVLDFASDSTDCCGVIGGVSTLSDITITV